MEALSPRSANLPMKPRSVTQKPRSDAQTNSAQVANNPDKIDEEWRPHSVIREPGAGGDAYLTGKKLGRGGFAVCFEGKSERTLQIVALKVVRSQVQQKKQLDKFRTELQIHAKMHHPSIVEFYRAFAFEDHTYVILELCPNGSLNDMVRNRRSLSLPEVRRYMIQICGGVKYMHQRWVFHRDLKMGNIFLDSHMNIKIGDFGLAAVVVDDRERRQTMCGTPNYIAPELLARSSSQGHGHEVDTWAIGIICYAMLIGSPPFASKSQPEIYKKLKHLEYEWKEDCQYFIPSQAKDLVALCLNLVPGQRPAMDDLVEHEFFKTGAIAEELDPSSLRKKPTWLKHADPRGDKVAPGYGVSRVAMCEACGVGKDSTGKPRPAVGGKVNISAMTEVHLENSEGCAPIVPMPEGVVYKEFTVAKEDWNAVKRRPITATKTRGSKDQRSRAETIGAKPLPKAPTGTAPSRSMTVALPSGDSAPNSQRPPQRLPVQSFAAQQRQQALLPQRAGRRVVSIRSARQTSVTGGESGQNETSVPAKQSHDEGDSAPSRNITAPKQPERRSLREQPIRASSRITRGTYARSKAQNEPSSGHTGTTTSDEGAAKRDAHLDENGSRPQRYAGNKARAISHTRLQPRPPGRRLENEHAPVRKSSLSSAMGSADMPLQAVNANGHQSEAATTVQRPPATETTSVTYKPPRPQSKATTIAPTDDFAVVSGSATEDVLSALRGLYRSLCPRNAVPSKSSSSRLGLRANAQPVVEKWVDYSEKYGVCYILSDGTAGLTLKSSEDNIRCSSSVVLRNGRDHYSRRAITKDLQVVPQGPEALPVEFYERSHPAGIKKMKVPARHFRYDDDDHNGDHGGEHGGRTANSTSRRIFAQLSARTKGAYEEERVRLVGILDKFGKYMITYQSWEDNGHDSKRTTTPAATSFVKFYQRLGNVGIWGFGNGSFQFNFPDHTKLVLYRGNNDNRDDDDDKHSGQRDKDEGGEWMLDLYHLQPSDAIYLSKHGSMSDPAACLDRRDSLSCPVSSVFSSSSAFPQPGSTQAQTQTQTQTQAPGPGHDQTTSHDPHPPNLASILTTNQIPDKLAWIRAVIRIWIRHAGLGRTGNGNNDDDDRKLAWTGLRDRTVERQHLQKQKQKEKDRMRRGEGAEGPIDQVADRRVVAERPSWMSWVTVGRDGGDGEGRD